MKVTSSDYSCCFPYQPPSRWSRVRSFFRAGWACFHALLAMHTEYRDSRRGAKD